MTRYTAQSVGIQPCRYGDENGQEYFVDCPCWLVIVAMQPNDPAGEIYEVQPGSFELWTNGEMQEVANVDAAIDQMNAKPTAA
jgi:hypothetical protein